MSYHPQLTNGYCAALTAVLLGSWGCQKAPPGQVGMSPRQAPVLVETASREPIGVEAVQVEERVSDDSVLPVDDAASVVQSQPFESPYPDRIDLFMPPKRTSIARDRSQGSHEDTIELLGFVNVGQQSAVLMINGLVVSLAEGSTDHGIEVLSIQPPAVVLQRGRQRWQAVLAN